MKVKALEAEIERMKEAHLLRAKRKAANDDSESARAERRVVTRARSPKKQRGCAAAERHISSLGDDLLLSIFLRLPSLATLVRAACTCRAWRRAVASSPAFRRSFRALHPPPLLGFIFQAYDSTPAPNVTAFPAFVPARPGDKDLVAAIGGGDFFYTSLLNRTKEGRCWEMLDVCRGYALLVNWADKLLAVFNPLTRQSEHVFDLVSQSQDTLAKYHGLTVAGVLLWPDEESMSFRVCLFAHDDSKIQFSFFTSDTGMWSVTPWVDFPVRPDSDVERSLLDRSFVGENGFLYWVYIDCRYIILLDTATMEFSVAELPQCVSRNFDVGHTKDRKACIVYADGFNIGVLMHTKEGDGVDRWVLDRVVPMDTELERVLRVQFDDDSELNVLDVRDGYVYLATSKMFHDPVKPCWFMTLCLETMKLEVLFQRTFDNIIRPYTMAWPPLLGNFGRLALEDAP
uniref:Uncharacterized protein n=1 Tax=Arundo donax TaxID=35708 RepID=A0A0A9AGA4_ARUDO